MIVALVLLGTVAVIATVNILKGIFRGLKNTVGSLIAIILSAVIAGIITMIIDKPNSALVASVMNWLMGALPDGGVREFLEVEAMGDAVTYYGVMLSAPFVFLILYSVISIIISIIIGIVIKYIPPFKKPGVLVDRLGGAGVGLVCTALVSLLVLFPIVGTLTVEGTLVERISAIEEEPSSDMEVLLDISTHNSVVNAMESMGCEFVYNIFASADYEGEKVYLINEVDVLGDIVYDISLLGGDMAEHDETQKEALNNLIDAIDHSPIVKHALAGVLSEASSKWLAGEEFVGMSKFSAGDMIDPLVDELLVIISTTDDYTVSSDLHTLADILIIIMDSGVLEDIDGQDMLTKLGEEGLIADLLVAVNANERTRPLADEITRISIRAMSTVIGVPANADERYDMLMDNVAKIISNYENLGEAEQTKAVAENLGEIFDDYGIKVSDEALDHVADGLIADLGDRNDLSGNDIKEFFAVYTIGTSEKTADSGINGFELLSDTDHKVEFNADGTITVDGVVLENYTADNYRESGAFELALSGVDLGDVATLDSAKNMRSTLLTIEDILKSLGSYVECDDVVAESEKVAEILAEVGKVLADMDLDNINYTSLLGKMGGVFDMMSDSKVLNSASASNIMTSILQSDMVKNSIGLKKSELTGFADKLNEYAMSADGSYASATTAVSKTVDAITKTSDTTVAYEEKVQATEEMIVSIDQGNAEIITSIVTDSLVSDMGVEVSNAETVTASVQSLINNMADLNASAPDETVVKEEAEAVTKILTLAMTGTNEGPLFDTEEEKGSVAESPDEFISTVVNSTVVMNTVRETVEGKETGSNPYGIGDFTEKEQENIENALQSYYQSNGGGEDLAAKLGDLAIALNVNFIPQ